MLHTFPRLLVFPLPLEYSWKDWGNLLGCPSCRAKKKRSSLVAKVEADQIFLVPTVSNVGGDASHMGWLHLCIIFVFSPSFPFHAHQGTGLLLLESLQSIGNFTGITVTSLLPPEGSCGSITQCFHAKDRQKVPA